MHSVITGGAGFIGSNLVQHALAHTADRLVIVDKLTYAGSLLNLERGARPTRGVDVRAGRHRRRAAMAQVFAEHAPRRRAEPGGRDARRSLDRRSAAVHRHQHRRHVRAARGGAATVSRRCRPTERRAFRFLHVSTDEVYGTLGRAACSPKTRRTRRTRRTRPARPRPIIWCGPTSTPTACRR